MNAVNALTQAKQMDMLARPLSWRPQHCGIAWTSPPDDVVGWTIEFDPNSEVAYCGVSALIPPVAELQEEWEVVPRHPGVNV